MRFGTNQAFYLFNTATSRAKGAYYILKATLGTSNGDLKFVVNVLIIMLHNQKHTLYNVINTNCITYSQISYNNLIFSNYAGKISSFIIKEVQA